MGFSDLCGCLFGRELFCFFQTEVLSYACKKEAQKYIRASFCNGIDIRIFFVYNKSRIDDFNMGEIIKEEG